MAGRLMNSRHWLEVCRSLIAVLIFLLIWIAVTLANRYGHYFNPMLFPGPMDVLRAGIDLAKSGELGSDLLASLSRIFEGFAIAAVAGVGVALLVSRYGAVAFFLEPIIEILRPIPPLAFLPMLVLWFGIGEMSKVSFIAYSAFFPVFTASEDGIRHVDQVLVRAARSLGATRSQIFRHVVLPAALPGVFTGLRLGIALSFFVIVAAEFLGANSGIGYLINNARIYFMVSQMLCGAVIIGCCGYLINLVFKAIERRLLAWKFD